MRLMYYCAGLGRHNSTHAPTSPSLLNTHEISYPHPNPTPLHHTKRRMPKYSCLQVCCQSINLKMAIRAETCSWYLCNEQHISNHQIVVFDSWLIQLHSVTSLAPCSLNCLLHIASYCVWTASREPNVERVRGGGLCILSGYVLLFVWKGWGKSPG